MNQINLKYLKELLTKIEYCNRMVPFPIYDTEYVNEIKTMIMKLEKDDDVNYDDDPVWACKYCDALVVPNCYDIDDNNNERCLRCGSINETIEYKTIYEYKNRKDTINGETT
jgi:hypothetical protein